MSEQKRAWRFNDGTEMLLDWEELLLRLPDGRYYELSTNYVFHEDLEKVLPLLGWTQDGDDDG